MAHDLHMGDEGMRDARRNSLFRQKKIVRSSGFVFFSCLQDATLTMIVENIPHRAKHAQIVLIRGALTLVVMGLLDPPHKIWRSNYQS